MEPVTIAIADDNEIVRQGIISILSKVEGYELIGQAYDGEAALKFVEIHAPKVLLLDIRLPKMNGLEVLRKLKEKKTSARVIILSMHQERFYVEKARKMNADGYVLKDSSVEFLIEAIKQVANGERYFYSHYDDCYRCIPPLDQMDGELLNDEHLTRREKEILKLIAHGASNSDLTRKFAVSSRTVEVHLGNISRKLKLKNRAEIIHYAIEVNDLL
jgi:DNA-binding NarL/FixJ family response regulator